MSRPLARGTAVALGLAALATAQPAHAATTLDAVCDEVGEVRLTTSAGTATALVDAPGLALAATGGQPCWAARPDAAGHLVVDRSRPVAHVVVDEDTVREHQTSPMVTAAASTGDPAGYGPVTAFPYASQLAAYANTRPGSASFAQRAIGSSAIWSFSKGTRSNVTASIVKVQVMAAVMKRAQREGRALTSWETSQMVPMIRYSDNDATTNLWGSLGGSRGVAPVIAAMGLRETTYDTGGRWGLTVTTAPDQVVLMDHFARPNPVLNNSMRAYGLSLMRSVSSDQDWGVTAGPGDDIAVKNGWLPRTDGWHVNSIGYSHKAPMPYTAASLSHSTSGSMGTQIATIEGLGRIVWSHSQAAPAQPASTPLALPLPPTTVPPRVRGDMTGDGVADVVATKDNRLWLLRGIAGGRLGAPRPIGGPGWARWNWLGIPGDVDRDGLSDLVARRDDGTLWLFRSTGSGVAAGRQVGVGWGRMSLLSAIGDLDANGMPDLLARTATGSLLRYELPRTGGAMTRPQIGRGWGNMVKLLGTSYNGDARADVMALARDGRMYRYASTGTSLADGQLAGYGWSTSAPLSAVGDLTQDGTGDLVLQRADGLFTYPVVRGGTFGTPVATGTTLAGFTRAS